MLPSISPRQLQTGPDSIMERRRLVGGQPAILSARAAAIVLLLGAPPVLLLDCIIMYQYQQVNV